LHVQHSSQLAPDGRMRMHYAFDYRQLFVNDGLTQVRAALEAAAVSPESSRCLQLTITVAKIKS